MLPLAFDRLRFDDEITGWVVTDRHQPWIGVAHVLTVLGNTLTLTIISVVVVAALVFRGRRSEAALLGAGALSGVTVMVALKHLVARSRPPVPDRLLDIGSYSFPSGHAMMSMVVFCLLAVVAYRVSAWVREHPAVLLVAPVLSVGIGLTRVYLGVHWPSDVLAGWMFGALWVVACVWVFTRVQLRARP